MSNHDCCIPNRPDGMTAHTARCLLAGTYNHLRLVDNEPEDEGGEPA